MTELIYRQRREAFISAAEMADDCAALITSPIDIAYLSGFTGSNGTMVIGPRAQRLFTDFRYQARVHIEAPGIDVSIPASRLMSAVFDDAKAAGIERLLIDESHVTIATLRTYETAAAGLALEPAALPTAGLRMTKDAAEVEKVRRACQITDEALAAVLPEITVGVTEKQIALKLERAFVDLGADGRAFESIVATGPNSAVPHHSPTDRAVAEGDLLKIDFGALYVGYHADETRTFIVGEPQPWQVEIHAVVAAAQAAGRAALRHGVTLGEVDAASRRVIVDAGYAEFFNHGLGHGVGLQIHEDPFFRPNSSDSLRAGYTVTIEPGIYLPDRGGVRIEDTLLVDSQGAESLTTTSRELRVIG